MPVFQVWRRNDKLSRIPEILREGNHTLSHQELTVPIRVEGKSVRVFTDRAQGPLEDVSIYAIDDLRLCDCVAVPEMKLNFVRGETIMALYSPGSSVTGETLYIEFHDNNSFE